MKFYFGRGDGGKTSLFGSSKRLSKNSQRLEALGSLDETVSFLGVCRSLAENQKVDKILRQVQEDLFIIQAEAGRAKKGGKKIKKKNIDWLEKIIDEYGREVSEIKNFIVPAGAVLAGHLDFARALARRAERKCVALENVLSLESLAYLNRLSSLLFVLARWVNKKNFVKENKPKY